MNEKELCAITPPYKFGCPDDWEYRDLPKMHPDLYIKLIETIADGNYKLLSYAEYPSIKCDKGFVVRGQLMVSPTGMYNLKKYLDENKKVSIIV